jgi:hypothetical protein
MHSPLFQPATPVISSGSNSQRRRTRTTVAWKQPEDNWNITDIPRSILPHLPSKSTIHTLPAPASVVYKTLDNDEKVLERLHEIKVRIS